GEVTGKGAVGHCQLGLKVKDAAAIVVGLVAGEGAVADRRRSARAYADGAAVAAAAVLRTVCLVTGFVIGEGAVADRQRAPAETDNAAAGAEGVPTGGVVGEGAVADRQRAPITSVD